MTGGGYRLLASGQTLEGSFSAVWTATIATKYSFLHIFRDLQDHQNGLPILAIFQCLCTVFQTSQNLSIFVDICRLRSDLDDFFLGISRKFLEFIKTCRELRKFLKTHEFLTTFCQFFLKMIQNACLLGPSGHPPPFVVDFAEKSGSVRVGEVSRDLPLLDAAEVGAALPRLKDQVLRPAFDLNSAPFFFRDEKTLENPAQAPLPKS